MGSELACIPPRIIVTSPACQPLVFGSAVFPSQADKTPHACRAGYGHTT